jgi:hypothetical protein
MDNQASYSDLFNFSDSTPIADAIKMIEQLEKVYVKMIETIHNQNSKLESEMAGVKNEAAALLKSIESMNAAAVKNADAYNKVAKSTDELSTTFDQLKKKEDDNAKSMGKLKDQVDNLKKAKDDLKKQNVAEAGSIDDLKKQLDEATKKYKSFGDATAQSIKNDQLKKIADLDAAHKSATKSINDAKKATDFAAGSYNELSARLNANRKALREMEGGIQGNTKEFEKLRKQIKEDDKTLKEWDDSVGQNQRSVGDYKNQIAALVPGFGNVSGAIDSASAAGKAFIATPLGVFLLLVTGALATLTSYFKGSVEGQDRFNNIMNQGKIVLEFFNDGLETVGKTLVEVWDNPGKAAAEFWQFLKNNLINRVLALPILFKALGKIIASGFTEGYKDFTNATLQLTTGVEDLIGKSVQLSETLAKEAARRLEIANKLSAKENLIRKEKIKDVVDDAQTELKVNKLLEESKDKISFADQDRLAKVRQARKLVNDQLVGDLELAQLEIDAQRLRIQAAGGVLQANKKLSELTNEEITAIGVKYELIEQLAQLEAAQINTEAAASVKRKALQKQEIGLIQEISTAYFDRIKREKQAQVEIDTFIANSVIKRNNIILNNEDSTLTQRLEAVKSNGVEELNLLEINRAKQLDAIREASLAKVELDSETSAKIFSDQTKSLTQQLEYEKQVKEAALMNDARYSQERGIFLKEEEKINKEFFDNLDFLNQKSNKAAEDNIFKTLDRDFKTFNSNVNAEISNQLTVLNESFAAGNETIKSFEDKRRDIQTEAIRIRLTNELNYLKEVLQQNGLTNEKIAELEAKSADIRRQLSEQTATEILNNEKQLREAINAIGVEGVEFGQQLFNQGIQQNIDGLNAKIQAETEAAARSVAIVGNDAQAKAVIEQNLANKKKAIEREISAEKRKQAIFQKALNIGSIIIDTAKAVVAALPNIPLSIASGVIGAIQLAAVIAQPIPGFYKGTESSPEGLAMVGERGREIGIDPSGDVRVYDKPQLTYLEKGTKILNKSKSDQLIDQANKFGDGYGFAQNVSAMQNSNDELSSAKILMMDTDGIISALVDNKTEVVNAIKSQPQDEWDDEGYRRFIRSKNSKVERLDKRYKLG